MAVKKKFTSGAKSSALGRGLDALISTEAVRTEGSTTISEIPVEMIEANPNQPRREFDEVALQDQRDWYYPTYHPPPDFGKPLYDYRR